MPVPRCATAGATASKGLKADGTGAALVMVSVNHRGVRVPMCVERIGALIGWDRCGVETLLGRWYARRAYSVL